MGFFTVSHNPEAVKDRTSEGSFMTVSGIYQVLLKTVYIDVSGGGSEFLDFLVDHDGNDVRIFRAISLTNNDGKANEMGQTMLNKLAIVCGLKDGEDIPDPKGQVLPIGPKGEDKECQVLEFFNNQPVYLRIQIEHSLYEGKYQTRRLIRNVFRVPDKATAAEIVEGNKSEFGKQYEIEQKYSGPDKDLYRNDLDEEQVKELRKNRSKEAPKEEPKKPATTKGFTRRFGKT